MPSFPLEILYDGSCPVCSAEMKHYRQRNPEKRLHFVDISAADFQASDYDKTQDELMGKMHVRDADGRFATGVEAFQWIWLAFPQGSIYRVFGRLIGLPGINLLAKAGYALFARYRHLLPKRKDCKSDTCNLNDPR